MVYLAGTWPTLFSSYLNVHASLLIMGDIQIPHSRMTKACSGNIGDLFVICMRQVTKGHLYHLLGVLDYYVMYKQRAKYVL